jgi:ABC-type Mn2+/Zn2+ transport system permease subunit/Mn-dependent DtxR family transcriptional regulator
MDHLFDLFQQVATVPAFSRALLASSMVGIMCGILGCFIVLRNMALVGDAIAHAILPGVVFAFILVGNDAVGFFVGSVIAALLMAVAITWIQQKVNTKNDAAIGIVFTTMFAIGVIGISSINRNAGVHLDLKDFLFGNPLGVSNEDLYLTLGVLIYVIISVTVYYRYLFATTFQSVIAQTMGISASAMHYFLMLMMAFSIVASLRTVGIILVVAMLITPAATALLLSKRLKQVIVISALVGLISAVIGLYLSVAFETPPAPLMAVVAALFYLLAVIFSPQKGLLVRAIRKRNLQIRIRQEDLLKRAYRLSLDEQLTFENLQEKLAITSPALKQQLQQVRAKNFFEKSDLKMTNKGKEVAERLIRAHRLWETYQVEKMGLSEHQIHDEAERYEHLFSEELIDEVDNHLGYPTVDPHGSPIPSGLPLHLAQLAPKQAAVVLSDQSNKRIAAQLWDLGLLPETELTIEEVEKEVVHLLQSGRRIEVPMRLAALTHVKV